MQLFISRNKMATSLRFLSGAFTKLHSYGKMLPVSFSRRYLLSEAYSCNEAWNSYLQDPTLNQVNLSEFAFQIRDQLERTGRVSAVDMNILTHQFHKMDEDEVEFMEDILARYNLCQDSFPRNDSTIHSIVRGFLNSNNGNQLAGLLLDRFTYGLFPNHYTLNLLLDWYIKQKDFVSAAKVAYHSMLQEDFSNSINTLLSLHASVQHLLSSNIDDLAPPPKEESDGEEDWIKVNYIKYPYYDDHFDIKDERFLLGKTLLMLGNAESVDLPTDLRNSLKIIGCGLYHKFPQGLALLCDIADSADSALSQKALDYFSESLEKVEARDPDEPEVELALRTIDDVIHRMLPTSVEKENYQQEFAKIREQLSSQGKIVADYDLGKSVEDLVTNSVSKYEESEISNQLKLFPVWSEERQSELQRQIAEYRKTQRIEEMKEQIKALQEQEEVLTYFDYEEKIRLTFDDEEKASDPNLTISK